ncbi:hypothetical protein F5883DRAFT_264214 [Diaporthe sp. PMI_573]|nr:hypothetical protein F5883DRAFT_264214 [Diaporthaceae sp. PMI_573]
MPACTAHGASDFWAPAPQSSSTSPRPPSTMNAHPVPTDPILNPSKTQRIIKSICTVLHNVSEVVLHPRWAYTTHVAERDICKLWRAYHDSLSNVKNHMKTHTAKTVECPGCPQKYVTDSAMARNPGAIQQPGHAVSC